MEYTWNIHGYTMDIQRSGYTWYIRVHASGYTTYMDPSANRVAIIGYYCYYCDAIIAYNSG
jgi:hypothetical protein